MNLYGYRAPAYGYDILGLIYDVYFMCANGLTGHAWIQLSQSAPKTPNVSEIVTYKGEKYKIQARIPDAVGFWPYTAKSRLGKIGQKLLQAFGFYMSSQIKRDKDEYDSYRKIFVLRERIVNGKKELTPYLNAKQYGTSLLTETNTTTEADGNNPGKVMLQGSKRLDKNGKPVCCRKLDASGKSRLDYDRIKTCLKEYKTTEKYHLHGNNCRQVGRKILHSCCLLENDKAEKYHDISFDIKRV